MKVGQLTQLLEKRLGPVAFTPKGGCPLKVDGHCTVRNGWQFVAFTPKGGCPLKGRELRTLGWGSP